MRTQPLGTSDLVVPVIAVGCMRINTLDTKAAEQFVQTALDHGATFLITLISMVAALAKRFSLKRST